MRAAADGEDGSVKHVAMENRLYPMRELLGELLQMGQAAPALREFEASLRRPRTAIAASTDRARGGGSRRPPEGARVLREARHTGAEGGYPAAGNRARKGTPRPALSRASPRPRAENERPMVPSKPVEFADQTPP